MKRNRETRRSRALLRQRFRSHESKFTQLEKNFFWFIFATLSSGQNARFVPRIIIYEKCSRLHFTACNRIRERNQIRTRLLAGWHTLLFCFVSAGHVTDSLTFTVGPGVRAATGSPRPPSLDVLSGSKGCNFQRREDECCYQGRRNPRPRPLPPNPRSKDPAPLRRHRSPPKSHRYLPLLLQPQPHPSSNRFTLPPMERRA